MFDERNWLDDLDSAVAELDKASKAIVAHNKYLHAHRYDINKEALRALGMVD